MRGTVYLNGQDLASLRLLGTRDDVEPSSTGDRFRPEGAMERRFDHGHSHGSANRTATQAKPACLILPLEAAKQTAAKKLETPTK